MRPVTRYGLALGLGLAALILGFIVGFYFFPTNQPTTIAGAMLAAGFAVARLDMERWIPLVAVAAVPYAVGIPINLIQFQAYLAEEGITIPPQDYIIYVLPLLTLVLGARIALRTANR